MKNFIPTQTLQFELPPVDTADLIYFVSCSKRGEIVMKSRQKPYTVPSNKDLLLMLAATDRSGIFFRTYVDFHCARIGLAERHALGLPVLEGVKHRLARLINRQDAPFYYGDLNVQDRALLEELTRKSNLSPEYLCPYKFRTRTRVLVYVPHLEELIRMKLQFGDHLPFVRWEGTRLAEIEQEEYDVV